jgi:hypothetical protein
VHTRNAAAPYPQEKNIAARPAPMLPSRAASMSAAPARILNAPLPWRLSKFNICWLVRLPMTLVAEKT